MCFHNCLDFEPELEEPDAAPEVTAEAVAADFECDVDDDDEDEEASDDEELERF